MHRFLNVSDQNGLLHDLSSQQTTLCFYFPLYSLRLMFAFRPFRLSSCFKPHLNGEIIVKVYYFAGKRAIWRIALLLIKLPV